MGFAARFLVSLCIASFCLVLFPRFAAAQTPTVQVTGTVTRVAGPSKQIHGHQNTPKDWYINYQDCVDDVQIAFPLLFGSLSSSWQLEIWATDSSSTCNDIASRQGSTATCWKVADSYSAKGNESSLTFNVRAQDLLSRRTSSPESYTAADASACGVPTASGPVAYSVNFMWVSGSQIGTPASFTDLKADVRGPGAPTGVGVGADDGLLKVSWAGTTDSDVSAYRVYCDDGSTADAGAVKTVTTCVDGGTDEAGIPVDGGCQTVVGPATSGSGSCTSSVLLSSSGSTLAGDDGGVSTVPTVIDAKYQCGPGSISRTSTEAMVEGLRNGTRYAVAVAAVDSFDNVGALSAPACDAPTQTTDFWDAYRNAGGQAGGGFCSTGTAPVGPASFVIFGLVGVAIFVRVRRRA